MRVATTFALYGPEAPEIDLDSPAWLLNSVAASTGVGLAVLKAWLSRDPVVVPLGPYDQEARGKGSARLFTLRRVLAVAITAELVRLGIAPSRAGELATTFMDGFITGQVPPPRKRRRLSQVEKLSEAKTDTERSRLKAKSAHWRCRDAVLVAYPDTDALWVTRRDDNLVSIKETAGSGNAAAIILFYDSIIDRVCSRLAKTASPEQNNEKPEKRSRRRVRERKSR